MTGPEYDKVVLRYLDGEMKKRLVSKHVSLTRNTFNAITADGVVEQVKYSDLKAVFYVKNLDGNRDYHDSKAHRDNTMKKRRQAQVFFKDGEVMRGTVMNYSSDKQGFFLTPADPDGNDEKVFVVMTAINRVEFEDV